MSLGKRLETTLKNMTTGALRIFLAQRPRAADPPFKRILFIRYGGIGDMILSLPVFRAARARFPDSQIDVLCDAKNLGPLQGARLADHIDVYDKHPHRVLALISRLRRRDYDVICNMVVYPSFTFGILARLIGPRAVRIAGDQERFSYFYNRLVDLPPKREIHMIERLFLLAADITGISGPEIPEMGIPWVDYDSDIQTRASELLSAAIARLSLKNAHPRIAAVNISAGLERREWPIERFGEFLRIAMGRSSESIDGWIIIRNPQKPEEAERLVAAVGNAASTVLPVIDDFRVLMEFLRRVRLLVTPDTSFVHAASAMGTPVLDLIIGENAITWAPVGVPHRMVVSSDRLSLRELPVADVVRGMETLLEELHDPVAQRSSVD